MNGLVGEYYYTSHVTPEDHCSFASVETCVPVRELGSTSSHYPQYNAMGDVVEKIVDIYKPSSFSVVLFVNLNNANNRRGGRGEMDKLSISNNCNNDSSYSHQSLLDGILAKGRVGGESNWLEKFRLADKVSHSLGKWEIEFMHFEPKMKSANRRQIAF